jgi:hypothetical protein
MCEVSSAAGSAVGDAPNAAAASPSATNAPRQRLTPSQRRTRAPTASQKLNRVSRSPTAGPLVGL